MPEKIICTYLDLLGFKNFLSEDIIGAEKLINNYQYILSWMKNNDKIKSFNNFIPFSDSIFISSKNYNNFFIELSDFIKSSFLFVSNTYPISKDKQKPYDVTIAVGKVKDEKIVFNPEEEKWYPPLFRGGIAYDDVIEIPTLVINNEKSFFINNLFGHAVVQSYLLEQKVKGPRIIIDNIIMESLDKIDKSLIFKSFDHPNLYELYWPLLNCNNDVEFSFNNEIRQILEVAILLWKAFNHQEVSLYYYNFIKLITKGFLLFYKDEPIKFNKAKENILASLEVNGILDKKHDLV